MERDCYEVICGALTTRQSYGIDQTGLDVELKSLVGIKGYPYIPEQNDAKTERCSPAYVAWLRL